MVSRFCKDNSIYVSIWLINATNKGYINLLSRKSLIKKKTTFDVGQESFSFNLETYNNIVQHTHVGTLIHAS